jgi:hypothetical protein
MSSSASAPKPTVKGFSKKDLGHFEKRLLEERKRVQKELGHHGTRFGSEGDGDLSAYSFHMADQGTDAMEREKAYGISIRRSVGSIAPPTRLVSVTSAAA